MSVFIQFSFQSVQKQLNNIQKSACGELNTHTQPADFAVYKYVFYKLRHHDQLNFLTQLNLFQNLGWNAL